MQSYEYNGKKYDFILSIKAKIEIEKAQKAKLKNPIVAKIALDAKSGLENLTDEQLAAIIPHMDELGDLDPIEIGFIVLSSYPSYRNEVTREFFNELVEHMDMECGVESTYAFFVEVQSEVFTTLARMQKNQMDKAESQTHHLSIMK